MAPHRKRRFPAQIVCRESVESSLPNLNTSQYHTKSSALHDLYYTGPLQPWPNFVGLVRAHHESHTWRRTALGYRLQRGDPYAFGNCEVGEETGVQGRFQKYVGDVMNTIFNSQAIDIEFADSKCVPSVYSGVPDVIMKTASRLRKVVGELKVPWVPEHRMQPMISSRRGLRMFLAQPINYMWELNCAYGFFSNYEETIFLRQVMDTNGVWRIEYSPVIRSTTSYDANNPSSVSLRQCFFYVGSQASTEGPANNTTPLWVVQ